MKKVENLAVKADDQFYQIAKIEPTIESDEKNYFLSLEIPEHEKDNVNLGVVDRTIRINKARNMSERVELQDGTEARTGRSENIVRTVEVPEILNPHEVTKSYEDGTLTFKI